ncbi:PepSY domain-containing protein, partial [Acinetobacter baumannii]
VVFFAAWALAAVHGASRPHLKAWTEQLGFAALLYGALPLVNAATSNRHLGHSLTQGDWMLAGFDLAGLAAGLLLGWLSLRVARCWR